MGVAQLSAFAAGDPELAVRVHRAVHEQEVLFEQPEIDHDVPVVEAGDNFLDRRIGGGSKPDREAVHQLSVVDRRIKGFDLRVVPLYLAIPNVDVVVEFLERLKSLASEAIDFRGL